MVRKLAVIALAVFLPSVAAAFILPADAILARTAKKRSQLGLTTLALEGTRTSADGTKVRFREVMRTGKGRKVELLDGAVVTDVELTTRAGKRYRYKPGKGPGVPEQAPPDPVVVFLLSSSRDPGGQKGMAFLRKAGIDHKTTAMGRQDRNLAFIIGAKSWETERAQIWLDQETYAPLRLVSFQGETRHETRLHGFGSPLTQGYFPRMIERYVDGKLVERMTYDKIELNPSVDDGALAPG